MGFCLQCKKWVVQTEGKKQKQFCNSTCRSNYWYAQNKKQSTQPSIRDLTKPTHEIKPFEQPETNYSINTGAKPSKIEIEDIMRVYVEDRREISGQEEYKNWLTRLQNDDRLSREQKELVKNTH